MRSLPHLASPERRPRYLCVGLPLHLSQHAGGCQPLERCTERRKLGDFKARHPGLFQFRGGLIQTHGVRQHQIHLRGMVVVFL